ncbi:UNVERIFIED_CONTAM: hypothetical protein Sradi_5595000 [Sesamum radiatum]|uniref:Uncharacterized protein n=1 Tax=Sesamum radiatum TaxID=300843 RepID=A0AAW2KYA5_SESRA
MAADTKSSNLMKSKPSTAGGLSSSKPKIDSSASNKKAVEGSIKNSAADAKNGSSSNASKTEFFVLTESLRLLHVAAPGSQREPLRLFYESLSKQIPSSEMAEFWLMEHGLLSPEKAKRAYEKKQRKQKQLRTGTPIKSPPPSTSSRPESSRKPQPVPKNGEPKAKKRITNDSDDDDDFVLSHKRRKG